MSFAVHIWDRRLRKWREVRSGLRPLVCETPDVAEVAVKRLSAKGHVAVATAADESMAMRASPSGFWKWRRLATVARHHQVRDEAL